MRFRISVLIALVAVVTMAHAGTITQTVMYPLALVTPTVGDESTVEATGMTALALIPPGAAMTFNQFNTNLGTLNSVTISITDSYGGSVTFTNNGDVPATVSSDVQTNFELSLSSTLNATCGSLGDQATGCHLNGKFFTDVQDTGNQTITALAVNATQTTPNVFGTTDASTDQGTGFTGCNETDIAVGNDVADNDCTNTNKLTLTGAGESPYEHVGAGGTVTIYELVKGIQVAGSVSGVAEQPNFEAGSEITISYNYTPGAMTPEPASLLLLGSGLSLAAAKLRKRKTSQS